MLSPKVAVVIPCYKVKRHIKSIIETIGDEVDKIFVVDDFCPEFSGEFVRQNIVDPRINIYINSTNLGVGGAVMKGYEMALADGAHIIVKLDGDGQMDPALIPSLIAPLILHEADYTKGNRFFNLEGLVKMPKLRIFGNSTLSFLTKLSSGYWDIFDPTNGFTAIHSEAARRLPFNKISKRFFFETDILFRLNIIRAVVVDVPMDAKYENELSNLKVHKILIEFLCGHLRNIYKRIFYNYYLRDLSVASFELPLGILLFLSGIVFGIIKWVEASQTGITTPAGTVMLAALPTFMGVQFLLSFINYDIISVPRRPLCK